MLNKTITPRTVRSFVRREGRMTNGQKNALECLWSQYGVNVQDHIINLDALFGRKASCILEIGLGMGDTLVELAMAHPENDYIGIEVYRPGVGSLLKNLNKQGISNVRVIKEDVLVVLNQMISDGSLDAVYIFFPDPWPKKRHHKRRLIQTSFVELLAKKTKQNGVLHMVTDWEDYAHHMMAVMNHVPEFSNTRGQNRFSPRPNYRPLTKFEKRGQRLGHQVWDLIFNKPNTPSSPQ